MMPFWPRPETRIAPLGPDAVDDMAAIHAEAFARGWEPHEFATLLEGRGVLALGVWRRYAMGPRRLAGFVLDCRAPDLPFSGLEGCLAIGRTERRLDFQSRSVTTQGRIKDLAGVLNAVLVVDLFQGRIAPIRRT